MHAVYSLQQLPFTHAVQASSLGSDAQSPPPVPVLAVDVASVPVVEDVASVPVVLPVAPPTPVLLEEAPPAPPWPLLPVAPVVAPFVAPLVAPAPPWPVVPVAVPPPPSSPPQPQSTGIRDRASGATIREYFMGALLVREDMG